MKGTCPCYSTLNGSVVGFLITGAWEGNLRGEFADPHVSNRPRQSSLPRHTRGVGLVGRTGSHARVRSGCVARLLPGVLRSWLPGIREVTAAAGPGFLQGAWSAIGAAAAEARLTVILGTERVADGALLARPSQNRRSHGLNWGRGFLRLRTPTCCRKATSSSPRSVASGRRHRTKKEKPEEAGSWAQFTRRSAPERGRQGAGQDGLRLIPLFTSERPVMLTFN